MITRTLVSGLLLTALLGAPAVALAADDMYGDMTSDATQVHQGPMKTAAERCQALESQFDTAIKTHRSSGLATEANNLRSEGAQLCADGRHVEGIGELESALWDLGVTPKS
jgi:hypothetical protein